MARKPAKPLRLGAFFRQIVQTWRENQARRDLNGAPGPQRSFSPKENPARPKDVRGKLSSCEEIAQSVLSCSAGAAQKEPLS